MADIYKILRKATGLKSNKVKLLGIWALHALGKRYVGIFLDPVLACNFRCRMCYFSDEEKRRNYRGRFDYEDIELIAEALFRRALKLQIGCGAEPTLHKDIVRIIGLGKQYRVPFITITTNGSLITQELLFDMAEAGLNEITVSTHGLAKETYEYFMVNGSFETFLSLLDNIAEVKKKYPGFKFRLNYTINSDNLDELSHIWDVVRNRPDVLQLRPVQEIGNTEYKNFSMSDIYDKFDALLLPIIEECHKRNITCIAPQKENILLLKGDKAQDDRIEQATYCYVSPRSCWKDGFDYRKDSFESYSKAHGIGKDIFRSIFRKNNLRKIEVTRKMNYNIN